MKALSFLHHIDPLAKIVTVLPALLIVLFSRNVVTPLVFTVAALAVLAIGARFGWRVSLAIYAGIPVLTAVSALSLAVGSDPERAERTPILATIGTFRFTEGAALIGLAAGLRLGGIMALALVGGGTTNGPELVRSLVQNAYVPYRFGYTALAAYRFVPRFRQELQQIRAAHRVRGLISGRGPVAAIRRVSGYAVPLLAGAIRHAERVALSMDSRAFGIYRMRTERVVSPLRSADLATVMLGWAGTCGLLLFCQRW